MLSLCKIKAGVREAMLSLLLNKGWSEGGHVKSPVK